MRTKPALTDEDVKKMAAAAEAHALANQWHVTVAIFDDGGHLLYLHRMDNTAPSTVEMAIGKGRTAVLGRRETKVYEDIVKNDGEGKTVAVGREVELAQRPRGRLLEGLVRLGLRLDDFERVGGEQV